MDDDLIDEIMNAVDIDGGGTMGEVKPITAPNPNLPSVVSTLLYYTLPYSTLLYPTIGRGETKPPNQAPTPCHQSPIQSESQPFFRYVYSILLFSTVFYLTVHVYIPRTIAAIRTNKPQQQEQYQQQQQ